MAQVYPFRAFRYNPQRVQLERVVTQPYDKITPEMQQRYYESDPNNLISVEKGFSLPQDSPQNNVYTRAASTIENWIHDAILLQDARPAFYANSQEYEVPGTNECRTRHGFVGAGRLEDYSAGVIFRHEHTLSAPKADRLELLRHTRTQTGQLFMLYSDPERDIDAILLKAEKASKPAAEVRDEYGVIHRLWPISDSECVAAIQRLMTDEKLVIADGHHRYETALNYRNERRAQGGSAVGADRDAPYERAMMTFVNTHSEGLTILPTHRVVAGLNGFSRVALQQRLEPWFATEAFPFATEVEKPTARANFLARLTTLRQQRAIGVYIAADANRRAYYVLAVRPGVDLAQLLPTVSPPQRQLDVVLLHEGILEPLLGITPQAVKMEKNLSYQREANAALDAVDNGAAQVAFLLNPCGVEQVMAIATAGEVMPQKSTDFYPKLLSGIAMYRLDQ
jgi:uncharacterized protein (DUF1015 family)